MTKLISLLTAFLLIIALASHSMAASAETEYLDIYADSEVKVFSNPTLEDEFADDRILVVLSNDASLEFNDRTADDFSSIDCAKVRDLSRGCGQKIKQQYDTLMAAALSRTAVPESVDAEQIGSFNQILCIELEQPGKDNVLAAIEELQRRDDVLYAAPDYVISLSATTNTATNDPNVSEQWALDAIQLSDAWDVTTGSPSVMVGILDTGIDAGHPDLDGRVDSHLSADFTLGHIIGEEVHTIPNDPMGHGTHVAGIIGAITNNGTGMAGACSGVTLVSLRIFDENGSGYSSNLALAIEYAESNNIPILNFSGRWNLEFTSHESLYNYALDEVIENYGGLFVCAAGNDYSNNDTIDIFPANCHYLHTITVGAGTPANTKAPFSNYGVNTVDIFAPGVDILSCYPTEMCINGTHDTINSVHEDIGYHTMSGTSMATPYVTAVAALMLSENPSLTPIQIKHRIMNNCDQYNTLSGYCISGGVVNAYKAVLNACFPTTATLNSNWQFSASGGRHMWFMFVVPSDDNYYFYTEGDVDTIGELFSYETGLIEYCDDNQQDDGEESNYNFYIAATNLKAGDVLYLRVTAAEWLDEGVITLKITA